MSNIKALFFSRYLGTKIYTPNLAPYTFTLWVEPTSQSVPQINIKDAIELNGYLLLRSVEQLTDEELNQIGKFVHQMPGLNFEITRNDDIIHVQNTDHYGITRHFSMYKNYGAINANHHFEKTDKEPFKTFSHNIGEISTSSKLPIPYIAIVDYLRSLGILLQFTYLDEANKPITLSPAELIAKGWVKIKDHE